MSRPAGSPRRNRSSRGSRTGTRALPPRRAGGGRRALPPRRAGRCRGYPALAEVPADLFGICLVSTGGRAYAAGDADREFTIMSVSKPFVFALACERLGPAALRDRVGVNGTGLAFNSLAAVETSPDGRTNPIVNAGAIATTSLLGDWSAIHDGLSRFAGRELPFDDAVYASASATNHRNQ